jgi:hypothetical protein
VHQHYEPIVPAVTDHSAIPRRRATTALALRPVPSPSLRPAPAPYAPGRLRTASDHEAAVVAGFKSRFPEFERLGHDELLQIAATYLSDDDHLTRAKLRGEGVPAGWRRDRGDDADMSLEHGLMGSDYA